ncbi:response regulator [Microlunatus parietis]|uniref:DNA-binding NarL/FixJ family response regulator n=1 Tax=Microlunatus parietis TaxID=682979 RepID=A0A7Y9I6V6_9ACTN|nr:response regulator transcription factor [Microlunatus parietis]NYE70864.1 DNA-binding NarL/FixJ family response regulator [Microlunatus parietis]
MITVLVADDQAMVRAGFVSLLRTQPDLTVIGEASDGAAAVRAVRELRPDVVIMDVRMPELDGIEATRQLLAPEATHRPKIVVLTTFDVDDYVYAALRYGASGFLLKDSPPEDLVAAIRVVAAGDALLAPSVTRRLIEDMTSRRPADRTLTARLRSLTNRELEVLTLIARARSNAEIATELSIAEETVKSHVGRLFGKLGLRDRAQAVVFAYESGLVTPGAR